MIRKILYFLGKSRRRNWVLVSLLGLTGSALEAIGAVMILVLLGLIVEPAVGIELPLIGSLPMKEGEETLLLVAAGVAVFFVIRGVTKLIETYVLQRVVHGTGLRIASELVDGYLAMPYEWHLHRDSASLMRNVHESVSVVVRQVLLPSVRMVVELSLLLALLIVLVIASPLGTALALAVLGPTSYVLIRVVQPALKRYGSSAHDAVGRYFGTVQQSLAGIRDVKILGRERFFSQRFHRDRSETARASYMRGTVAQIPAVLIEITIIFFILGFLAVAMNTGEPATAALPLMGLFAYAGLRMQPSLQKIVAGINSLRFATAPVDEVYGELQEIAGNKELRGTSPPLALHFDTAVVFDEVSFRYRGSSTLALEKINLSIAKGESVGVCGPTGGGKTTLVDLLAGLLEPTSGSITVDGVNMQGRESAWQQNLGVVSQSAFLLDDTLRRNVALGVPDGKINESAVVEAIDHAQLSEFVDSLPDGLETMVGERGIRISGGQRQRVAIARALYQRPSVLILDEGTSALDNITEAQLIRTLDTLQGQRTIIIVAHRLTTIRNCDKIVLITGGKIAEIGRYDELMVRSSEFQRLAQSG